MKKRIIASIISTVLAAIGLCGCAASGYAVYNPQTVFSDDILFNARMLGGNTAKAHKRMCEIIEQIDAQVSVTRENSDIARFNAAGAGERVEVGAYAYELFNTSLEYYTLTDGAFNCAASPLATLWHVDAAGLSELTRGDDGERINDALPTADEVKETLSYCDPNSVIAESENGKYYLTKSDARTKLDFGGIAKGYAVDKCVEVFEECGVASALIDISGNMYAYGEYMLSADGKWNIGVTSPRPRVTLSRGVLCALSLSGDESAVTSGDYMRYYRCDAYDTPVYVTHIIGRDGVPIGVTADGDGWKNTDELVVSATVIGGSSAVCDVLSTSVCVLGLEGGAKLLQKVGYKGLIFTEKRYTIIGEVSLYKPDEYDEHKAYEYVP